MTAKPTSKAYQDGRLRFSQRSSTDRTTVGVTSFSPGMLAASSASFTGQGTFSNGRARRMNS